MRLWISAARAESKPSGIPLLKRSRALKVALLNCIPVAFAVVGVSLMHLALDMEPGCTLVHHAAHLRHVIPLRMFNVPNSRVACTRSAVAVGRGGESVSSEKVTDGSWELPGDSYSGLIRSLPGSKMQDRKTLQLGKQALRAKAKMVKPERVTNQKSTDVAAELLRVMRGPSLPGREKKGGVLTAPQLGTPSRLIVFEDPESDIKDLSDQERLLQGREKPCASKAIFNPRVRPATDKTAALWERNPSMPGYRALVERPLAVEVQGLDPNGNTVKYIAKNWEARMVQQAVDVLDGVFFTDRCCMRSLRHLDAQNDPLPPDCPRVGMAPHADTEKMSEDQLLAAAEKGGSQGIFGGLPMLNFGEPLALLVGSLLLRLRTPEVDQADVASSKYADIAKTLRDAIASGNHPLGAAAPQFRQRVRAIAVGETSEQVDELSARARVNEEHQEFGPLVLFNPVIARRSGSQDAFFFERSASVPGYEGVVGRAVEVTVTGLDVNGEPVKFIARGWKARMLQHAADVLDGILYVDRMERKSFRRDTIDDDFVEGVPYGVRAQTPAARKKTKASGTKLRTKARGPKASAKRGGRR